MICWLTARRKMAKAKIPSASVIEAQIDEDGCIHLVLLDAKGRAFAGAVLSLDGAISVVEDLSDLIDDFLEGQPENPDTIGPCVGTA
ncbi:hypothetical protein NKJ09_23045 [Mesorhizobium sp. M0189]|uniref:hypothetical protein n=1 Tax=Mesorhizobium sp. M0189 TaxID=2956909 RepID=UPI003336EBCD